MNDEETKSSGVQSEEQNDATGITKSNLGFWQLVKKHSTLTAIIIGLMVVVIVYLWKDMEIANQKTKIEKVAKTQIHENQQELLKLVAKPFVWSIRTEMLRGNLEQVNILITDMVKENNFVFIHLIEPNGNVLLSTNKRIEGQQIGEEIDRTLLNVDSSVIKYNNQNEFVVAAPVMGVDRRLAMLVFGYTPTVFVNR
jgi:hypothetical protein